ncbi:hypothetical protein ABZ297_15885 [Nonomuraea sp. NPDC005983]|uniref:GbsR/MarR family transcriptional regulator n=1 Tax=Nonomuraea sp. NPDC005983 TaxID=3155595 RepID=UPI00339F6172
MNARRAFTVSVGDLLASWNLPHATGRVYGLLLISADTLTLDEIAGELELSKGAVSTAVRQLDPWGLARVIPQPGSRRLQVEASCSPGTGRRAAETLSLLLTMLARGH